MTIATIITRVRAAAALLSPVLRLRGRGDLPRALIGGLRTLVGLLVFWRGLGHLGFLLQCSTRAALERCRAAAPRVITWARRRAAERSTWIGLAAVAAALGKSVLADHLTKAADIVPMVLGAGGAAIAAASTSSRPLS